MKKIIILIILFFLCTIALSAQTYVPKEEFKSKVKEPNDIYLVFQPTDMGIGLRYDRMFSPQWGSYIAITHGEYELETGEKIDNHFKVVSGVLIYIKPIFKYYRPYLGVGLSYNGYSGLHNIPPTFPPNALTNWSFELSCNAKISNNWNFGIRMDPIKWETSIDLGFSF